MVDVQHLNDDIHDLTVENLIAVSDNEIENMVFAVADIFSSVACVCPYL